MSAGNVMKSWMVNGSYSAAGFCAEVGWGWWRWGIRYQTDYHASDFEHGILRIGLGWWQLVYFVPDVWICRWRDVPALINPTPAATDDAIGCHAGKDGDCIWPGCPQARDNEPHATNRHCPLDILPEEG